MTYPGFAAEAAILANNGWFAGLPEAFRGTITEGWIFQRVEANQALSHGGDDTGGMIGLARGTALVFSAIGTADAGPIHVFRPPYWYGLLPSTEGRARFVSVVARSDCIVARVPQHVITGLLTAHPIFWRHMHELTMIHLELTAQTASDLAIRDSKRRLVAVMLRAAGVSKSGDATVSLDLSQEDISSMANISRQTTGVLFAALKASGHIQTAYRTITLPDPGALRTILAT